MTTQRRVAAYCHVSAADQDPGLQLDEVRVLAEQRGWHLAHEFIDRLSQLGVERVSVRDHAIDTTEPSGRHMLSIVGAFAEFERNLIAERTRAGMERARRQGKSIGHPE